MKGNRPSFRYETTSSAVENESASDTFDVFEFIQTNYRIFATMGVFGALMVYLANFAENPSQPIQIGIVSSVWMFAMAAVIVIRELFSEFGGSSEFIDSMVRREEGAYQVMFFIVPFIGLSYSFLSIFFQFRSAFGFLLQGLSMIAGFFAVLLYIDWTEAKLIDPILGEPTGASKDTVMFGLMLVLAAASSNLYEILALPAWEFTSENITGAVASTFTRSVWLFSILLLVILALVITNQEADDEE